MKFETFSKIIEQLKSSTEKNEAAYKLGIDLIEFTEDYVSIIESLIKEIYGESGADWFGWFCWENDFGEGDLTASDGDDPICYDVKSLWEYLENIENN